MRKIIIPTILTATVLIAGMFALMPVERATTVHTTIQNTQLEVTVLQDTEDAAAAGGTAVFTLDIGTAESALVYVEFDLVDMVATDDITISCTAGGTQLDGYEAGDLTFADAQTADIVTSPTTGMNPIMLFAGDDLVCTGTSVDDADDTVVIIGMNAVVITDASVTPTLTSA